MVKIAWQSEVILPNYPLSNLLTVLGVKKILKVAASGKKSITIFLNFLKPDKKTHYQGVENAFFFVWLYL